MSDMGDTELNQWPVAIIEDRYSGAYSGGRWIAIAHADCLDGPTTSDDIALTRINFIVGEEGGMPGPFDGDSDAMLFWTDPPDWVAVGDTPDQALMNLRNGVKAAGGFWYIAGCM